MKYYKKTVAFVRESFSNKGMTASLRHFWRTAYWLKKLYPKADEAMLVAAVAHDLERAYGYAMSKHADRGKSNYTDRRILQVHSINGARLAANFLKRQRAPASMQSKVLMMISGYEFGGNKWQNLLRDADSISHLENNVRRFIAKRVPKVGAVKVRQKVDWMYQRIGSPKARAIAKPMYQKAVRYLNKFYQTPVVFSNLPK